MLNLDPAKLLVLAVVAVILLGPDKLPQVARQAGAAWKTFNEFRQRMETEVRKSVPDLPSSQEISRLARSPSAFLNHLSARVDESPTADGSSPKVDEKPNDISATPVSSLPLTPPVSDGPSEDAAPAPDDLLSAEIVFSDPTLN